MTVKTKEDIVARAFDTPIITNDQSIDRVLSAGLPVALVFLDGQPAAGLDQAMDRLAKDNAGQLLVAKVFTKDNPETTRRYQITQTPATATIRGGQVLSKAESISAADLERHVAFLLGKGPKPEAPRPAPAAGTRPAAGPGHTTRPSTGDGRPHAVNDATFDQEVLRSAQPVLVDFWAPWCGPCRMVEPIVEKLAHEMAGRLRVAKVNADETPGLSARYGIQGIPTMMVVKNGQIVDRWVGALPEPAIRSRVMAALNG